MISNKFKKDDEYGDYLLEQKKDEEKNCIAFEDLPESEQAKGVELAGVPDEEAIERGHI